MNQETRELSISVISDTHLATHASKAKELLKYLKSINPQILVLNGDIIDSWRFSRSYFPKSHLKVIRQLIKMLEKGTEIIYITGNHDEFLRKLNHSRMGNLSIVNQLVIDTNGSKTWILHGDVFDHIIHQAKWLAKLGAAVYGLLTLINKGLNVILKNLGFKEIIIYKSIKKKLIRENVKATAFEKAVSFAAVRKNYQTVICGHTHIPCQKQIKNEHGSVHYINCGDWVEHLTAAEYQDDQWKLIYFKDIMEDSTQDDELDIPNKKELYLSLFRELALAN